MRKVQAITGEERSMLIHGVEVCERTIAPDQDERMYPGDSIYAHACPVWCRITSGRATSLVDRSSDAIEYVSKKEKEIASRIRKDIEIEKKIKEKYESQKAIYKKLENGKKEKDKKSYTLKQERIKADLLRKEKQIISAKIKEVAKKAKESKNKKGSPDGFVSIPDAVLEIRCDRKTLSRAIERKDLYAIKDGPFWYVRMDEAKAYVASRYKNRIEKARRNISIAQAAIAEKRKNTISTCEK